jgi:hypothetical protein
MTLGDLSIDAYFRKIENIAVVLSGLGSPISHDDVVNIALDGLPEKYQHVSDIIIHRDPFPDLKAVRSMLTTAEMRLKSRATTTSIDATSSSPKVLLANTSNNSRWSNIMSDKIYKPCNNFVSGSCRFGVKCKFLHDGIHGTNSIGQNVGGSNVAGQNVGGPSTGQNMGVHYVVGQTMAGQVCFGGPHCLACSHMGVIRQVRIWGVKKLFSQVLLIRLHYMILPTVNGIWIQVRPPILMMM